MDEKAVTQTVSFPQGISATIEENAVLVVTGAKGVVKRSFRHPKVSITVNAECVVFSAKKFAKNEKKIFNTFIAHVNNMFKGASGGHVYKLRVCSGHFPMNVSLKGNGMEVKNFIGEAVPRTLTFKEGVSVKLDGDIVTVEGIDKELTAQTAASIEKLTLRNGFDRRRFQDGIYIIEKDGKVL